MPHTSNFEFNFENREAKNVTRFAIGKRRRVTSFSDDDIEKKGADRADDADGGEGESLSPEKNVA